MNIAFDCAPRIRFVLTTIVTCGAALLACAASNAQQAGPAIPSPATRGHSYLDVTTDTPLGRFEPGADITQAIQWACDHLHEHHRAIKVPSGHWSIHQTIDLPYRSGWTLLGEGRRIAKPNTTYGGSGTVIMWRGEAGGTMFRLTGTEGEFGNLTLAGRHPHKESDPEAAIGVLVERPAGSKGLGTGQILFRPLNLEHLKYGIQVGTDKRGSNCDNLVFEWLQAQNCEAIYRGVNGQGMDIVIQKLTNAGCDVGVLVDGGGMLTVQSSVTLVASTLLKVNRDAKVGHNNGYYCFRDIKVDSQAGNGFTMVDCQKAGPIDIVIEGGIQSFADTYDGTFARISKRNSLTIRDYSSQFNRIEGNGVVLLESCRVYRDDLATLVGKSIDARVRNCRRKDGSWFADWNSQAVPSK